MTLKEALARNPTPRTGYIHSNVEDHYNRDIANSLIQDSAQILEEAGLPQLVVELSEIIGEKFTDLTVKNLAIVNSYLVFQRIQWNIRIAEPVAKETIGPIRDSITLIVRPNTREILVQGNETQLLTEEQWKDKIAVEDAVAKAYQNPSTLPVTTPRI